ncbi:protein mono-ADP-ribosyltransferase PARP12-like [Haplochromis burtoni]|uniref:protein mono-ADP-ribosyltransferase PARP12-like n=1 Tax=Haplochromis burtoni TaxID=8153 RepID=UPI001C2DC102|nr:protein mono-ADP-ribosyltransferase PARP12-like [Haplochromis burtoni]
MATEILRMICAGQGAVNTEDLVYNLFSGDPTKLSEIISNREKFARCCPNGQEKVVARTRLRLCRAKDCPGTCRGLHLCKNFLFGFCEFSQLRRGCSFSHELTSEHNQRLLREHELESLSREELCTLLLQSDHTLLPAICYNYNNGDGEFGRCRDGDGCRRLHICENYISRECSCWKNHDFNAPQPFRALQARGVPDTLFQSLKAAYANKQALRLAGTNREDRVHRGNCSSGEVSANDNNTDESSLFGKSKKRPRRWDRGKDGNPVNREYARFSSDIHAADDEAAKANKGHNKRQRTVRDKTGICMYFIKCHCKHEDRCYKAHDKMPYRWQTTVTPVTLTGTHTIELLQRFILHNLLRFGGGLKRRTPGSDAHKQDLFTIHQVCIQDSNTATRESHGGKIQGALSTSPAVHFDTMTFGQNKVRRLSTENSVIEPTFIHTTEWLWYWQDGSWNMFASAIGGHKTADINSAKLEEKFLANDKDVVEFTAGSQSYSLSFQDMMQTNKRYGTKRPVCRRPRFVSAADALKKKVRRSSVQSSTSIPKTWDNTQIPQTGCSVL